MHKHFLLSVYILLIALASCQSEKTHQRRNLSFGWQFKAVDSDTWFTARVPGVVHTDLLENGLIPNPFIGTNEDSVQWVEEKQWEYRTTFTLTEEEYKYSEIDLVFDGLDTYAEIFLNGLPILSTNNMFRNWCVGVKEALVAGDNELQLIFIPPIEKNKSQLEQLGYALPSGSETGEWQVSPFTRKAAYQFGWDFAPRLVTMGIWQPVHLDFWEVARIEDTRFKLISINDNEANYTVYITIYSTANNTSCLVQALDSALDITLNAGLNTVAVDITIANPELWWPNGYGEPHLYNIPIKILSGSQVIDSVSKRLGIRTIELIQDFDSVGRSFYFKVNNVKIFAKGANWSPLSSYPSAIPDSTYVNRINSVRDAHMNMLRVWGGGIYEPDLFYDLCDENGIMVWQDFMFANSMYPGDEEFLENVKEEVIQQVNRLQTHPSIALWNGNNEIDVAWKNWGWQKQYGYSASDSTKIWLDYENLFRQQIPDIINIYDSARAYTSTSPLSNWGHPDNFKSGSMHYWGVWHGGESFEDYKTNVGRFMAEYGFQSYPKGTTINYYTGGTDFDLNDSQAAHQKSYVGNGLITKEISRYYRNASSPEFAQKSQFVQAIAYKTAIEAHRINKESCGGTLFWQLNDCWPGPSWSVIDYFGHQKLAYQVIKDRYKPVILVAERDENNFNIFVVSDLLSDSSATLRIELFNYDNDRVWVSEKQIKIDANVAKNIYRSELRKLLDGMPKDEVYLKLTLFTDDEILDVEKFYFVKPKDYRAVHDLIGLK